MKEIDVPDTKLPRVDAFQSRNRLEPPDIIKVIETIDAETDLVPEEVRLRYQKYKLARKRVLRYLNRRCQSTLRVIPQELMIRLMTKYGLKGVFDQGSGRNAGSINKSKNV